MRGQRWLATLSTVVTTVGALLVPTAPERLSAAQLAAMFTGYGNAGNGWTGGDATISVPLPDGRVAWLFADTFLGPLGPGRGRPPGSPIAHNTIVVQDGERLVRTLHGGTAELPEALVRPAQPGEHLWPASGVAAAGTLTVLYQRYRRTGDGVLDFRHTGDAVATFRLPSLTLDTVADLPPGPPIGWGSALLTEGAFTYVYGTSTAPGGLRFAHVARAPAGRLTAPWRYWTGAGWSPAPADAAPLLSGVGTGFGVQRAGDAYVLLTHETNLPFDPQFVAYTAAAPTGPFTGPRHVHTAPEAHGSTIVYDARLHPGLARDGTLLLSYNVNSLDLAAHHADVGLYRPRFVELPWPPPAAVRPPLAAPAGLTVTVRPDAAELTWAPVPGATAYRVHRRDVTNGQTHFARLPHPAAGPAHRTGLPAADHHYEFRVTAVDASGEGPPSATVTTRADRSRPITIPCCT